MKFIKKIFVFLSLIIINLLKSSVVVLLNLLKMRVYFIKFIKMIGVPWLVRGALGGDIGLNKGLMAIKPAEAV